MAYTEVIERYVRTLDGVNVTFIKIAVHDNDNVVICDGIESFTAGCEEIPANEFFEGIRQRAGERAVQRYAMKVKRLIR